MLLGVTPHRVNQMLPRPGEDPAVAAKKPLRGPEYPGGRAPKEAPRVWKWSLEQEQARRQEAGGRRRRTPPPKGDKQDIYDVFDQWMSRREARVNAAAQELKVAADLARQETREIRKEAARKVSKLSRLAVQQAEMITQLQADATVESEYTERVIDAYSSALTQLLAPDDIGPL